MARSEAVSSSISPYSPARHLSFVIALRQGLRRLPAGSECAAPLASSPLAPPIGTWPGLCARGPRRCFRRPINDDFARPTPRQLPAAACGGAPAPPPGESRLRRRLPARRSEARFRQVRRLDPEARREGHSARSREFPRTPLSSTSSTPTGGVAGAIAGASQAVQPGESAIARLGKLSASEISAPDPGDGADFRPAEAGHDLSQHQVLRHPRRPDRAWRIERRHDQGRRRRHRPDERRDQAHQLRGPRPDADRTRLRRKGRNRARPPRCSRSWARSSRTATSSTSASRARLLPAKRRCAASRRASPPSRWASCWPESPS